MANSKLLKFICMSVCVLTLAFVGCKKETEALKTEFVKDISGTWKISQLIRNGEDMSQRMDLSKFKIVFNNDNTYTLIDKMAFAVDTSGEFRLDDPQYPFTLILTEQGSTDSKQVKFEFPVVEGERRLSLQLSMGCSSNTYTYIFEKVQ